MSLISSFMLPILPSHSIALSTSMQWDQIEPLTRRTWNDHINAAIANGSSQYEIAIATYYTGRDSLGFQIYNGTQLRDHVKNNITTDPIKNFIIQKLYFFIIDINMSNKEDLASLKSRNFKLLDCYSTDYTEQENKDKKKEKKYFWVKIIDAFKEKEIEEKISNTSSEKHLSKTKQTDSNSSSIAINIFNWIRIRPPASLKCTPCLDLDQIEPLTKKVWREVLRPTLEGKSLYHPVNILSSRNYQGNISCQAFNTYVSDKEYFTRIPGFSIHPDAFQIHQYVATSNRLIPIAEAFPEINITPQFVQDLANVSYGQAFETEIKEEKEGKEVMDSKRSSLEATGIALNGGLAFANKYFKESSQSETIIQERLKWIEWEAKLGVVEAEYLLGHYSLHGRNLKKDPARAFFYLSRAAAKEHPKAMNNLGYCHLMGIGCPINYDQALKYYTAAKKKGLAAADNSLIFLEFKKKADKQDSESIYQCGKALLYGTLCEKNYEAAFAYLRLAVNQKYFPAVTDLGYCYEMGLGCEVNKTAALKLYRIMIKENSSEAKLALGRYLIKEGTNIEEGLKNLRAASFSNQNALFLLTTIEAEGKLCPQNLEQAFKAYQYLAEGKYIKAMGKLGECYFYGWGCKENAEKALYWLEESIKNGDPDNCHLFGKLIIEEYLSSQKNPSAAMKLNQNPKRALQLLELAAAAGSPETMDLFGDCYMNGIGCSVNPLQALEYYQQAAKTLPKAQIKIARIYQEGKAVEKNLSQAFELYKTVKDFVGAPLFFEMALNFKEKSEKEIGISKDLGLVTQGLEIAAEKGHIDALYELSLAYRKLYEKLDIEEIIVKAFQSAYRAAKQGHLHSMLLLGEYYMKGIGCTINYEEALMWYKKCLSVVPPANFYNLAISFTETEEWTLAFECFLFAAERGDCDAMYQVNLCYELGRGVDKNITKAFEWALRAAKQGHIETQTSLGAYFMASNPIQSLEYFCQSTMATHIGLINSKERSTTERYLKNQKILDNHLKAFVALFSSDQLRQLTLENNPKELTFLVKLGQFFYLSKHKSNSEIDYWILAFQYLSFAANRGHVKALKYLGHLHKAQIDTMSKKGVSPKTPQYQEAFGLMVSFYQKAMQRTDDKSSEFTELQTIIAQLKT